VLANAASMSSAPTTVMWCVFAFAQAASGLMTLVAQSAPRALGA
jgi:hypothetical protein